MRTEDEVIHGIHAAALNQQPWSDAITGAMGLVGAASGMFFTPYLPEADGGAAACVRMDESLVADYLREVELVDEWYHAILRRYRALHIGLVYHSATLMPMGELLRTRFYADYLAPSDIGWCLGTIVGDGSSERRPVAAFSMYRPASAAAFSDSARLQLARLQPHLTQALDTRLRLHSAEPGVTDSVLERLSTPVVLLGRHRRILLANAAAEALFLRQNPSLVRGGLLCAADPAGTAALDHVIAACADCRFDAVSSLSVRLNGELGTGVVARLVPAGAAQAAAAAIAFLTEEARSPMR